MMKYPFDNESCMRVKVIDECVEQFLSNENELKEGFTLEKKDEGELETNFVKPELLLRSNNPTPPSIKRPP